MLLHTIDAPESRIHPSHLNKKLHPMENITTTMQTSEQSEASIVRSRSNSSTKEHSDVEVKKKKKKRLKRSKRLASSKPKIQVSPDDYIYGKSRTWDRTPIVVEEYNLVFFTVPKVACTVWKKLFRRMMGYQDWNYQTVKENAPMLPHNPDVNGLKYLNHYSLEDATRLMTSPQYTRAIFVRDPKERFVSAFLDKALRNQGSHLEIACCPNQTCAVGAQWIRGFLRLAYTCYDDHWRPITRRFEKKYWPFINFVGHFSSQEQDARHLLERIGAWEKFGKSGWGKYGNESMFMSSDVTHTTGAASQVQRLMYSTKIEREIEEYYAEDYANPWLNLTKKTFFSENSSTVNGSKG